MSNCTCECNFNVKYCCVENVPVFFNNDFSTNSQDCRLFYDPTCLCCVVKPCDVQITCKTGSSPINTTVTLYAAKIVGCMPYQAEWRFDNPATCNKPQPPTSRNATICCQSTACFDNAVRFGCKEDLEQFCECVNRILSDPAKACSLITNNTRVCELFKCCDFTPITTESSTQGKCTNRFVRFTGEFIIDDSYLTSECNGQ